MTRYDADIGIDHGSRKGSMIRKGTKVALRLRGVPDALTLPSRLDSAIQFDFPPIPWRFANQAIMPRSRMR
jgi:hypothetical protein